MRHFTTTLMASALCCIALPAFADAPLTGRGVEASANAGGAELRAETGDRSRPGVFVNYDLRGQGIGFGPSIAYVAVRHRSFELRGYSRLSLTRFLAEPQGWVAGTRIGVRSVLRSDHVGFWLGPMLDAATELDDAPQQRITPALGAGFGAGPAAPWPWLWASAEAGYTFGGETRGAVTASWYLSLVLQR